MAKKTIKEVNDEIRGDITKRLVAAMEKGLTPWRKMWSMDPNAGFPANVKSKRHYNGINVLLLELTSIEQSYSSRWWGTYNNWKEVTKEKYPIKKGEKGTKVMLIRPIPIGDDDDDEKSFTLWLMKTYTVFNVEQCKECEAIEGLLVNEETDYESHPDYAKADEVVAETGADIRYKGNRAFYALDADYIQMPRKNQYPLERDFHDTRHHELVHWTESRLEWDRKAQGYDMGELIAEIGACFLSRELGIPGSDDLENHAKYLKHWLKGMKNDPKFIFEAAQQASKAVDYILKREKEVSNGKPRSKQRKRTISSSQVT